MHVTQLEWIITLAVTIAVLLFDVVVIGRRPHEPSKRELVIALSIYIGLAVAFGIWVWNFHGSQYGVEFFAGWLTEYSLSVDNLFIFLIIMVQINEPAAAAVENGDIPSAVGIRPKILCLFECLHVR